MNDICPSGSGHVRSPLVNDDLSVASREDRLMRFCQIFIFWKRDLDRDDRNKTILFDLLRTAEA